MNRVPPPHDGSLVADDKPTAVHINRRSKLTVIPPGVPPGVPPPHDGSLVADSIPSSKSAVHINRRSKLTVIPPKDDTDVDEGVPPPHDGPSKPAVHINRRSKLTVIPPKDDSGEVGRGSASAAGASGVSGASGASGAVSGAVMTYISSLSPLEQHVCRIAESHLESSFDILRSTGYIAWKAKNATTTK
jgi:hypothetical protein